MDFIHIPVLAKRYSVRKIGVLGGVRGVVVGSVVEGGWIGAAEVGHGKGVVEGGESDEQAVEIVVEVGSSATGAGISDSEGVGAGGGGVEIGVDFHESVGGGQSQVVEDGEGESFVAKEGGAGRIAGEVGDMVVDGEGLESDGSGVRFVSKQQIEDGDGVEDCEVAAAVGHGTIADIEERLEDSLFFDGGWGWEDEGCGEEIYGVDGAFDPTSEVEESPSWASGGRFHAETAEGGELEDDFIEAGCDVLLGLIGLEEGSEFVVEAGEDAGRIDGEAVTDESAGSPEISHGVAEVSGSPFSEHEFGEVGFESLAGTGPGMRFREGELGRGFLGVGGVGGFDGGDAAGGGGEGVEGGGIESGPDVDSVIGHGGKKAGESGHAHGGKFAGGGAQNHAEKSGGAFGPFDIAPQPVHIVGDAGEEVGSASAQLDGGTFLAEKGDMGDGFFG